MKISSFTPEGIQPALGSCKRMVVDFPALVNLPDEEAVNVFINYILENDYQVAVSKDIFNQNCEVLNQSSSVEQRAVQSRIDLFIDTLRKKKRFFQFRDALTPEKMISSLGSKSTVCFFFFWLSDFADCILKHAEELSARCLIVGVDHNLYVPKDIDDLHHLLRPEIDPGILKPGVVKAQFEAVPGAEVKTRDGIQVTLGKELGHGGEGRVFECDYQGTSPDGYVTKIYHPGKLNLLRLKKLNLMEKNKISYDGLCWPEKMVFSMEGKPLGYLMKKISGKNMARIFAGPDAVEDAFPNWKRRDLVQLCIQILLRYQYLHIFGILIGDMRLKNIVIDSEGKMSIADIDSAQIGQIPCPVGYGEFTPPELQGISFEEILRTTENESFSVAVVIFRILFLGLHPYDCVQGADTIEEDIRNKQFPYPAPGSEDYSRIPWGGYAPIWKNMPIPMRTFFREIFLEERRPSLIEILAMLKLYDSFLEQTEEKLPLSNQLSFDPEESLKSESDDSEKKKDDQTGNRSQINRTPQDKSDDQDDQDGKQKHRSWFSRLFSA